MNQRDSYGGFQQVIGRATGWFHLEEIHGRWWFVTPEGRGFIATGFNHAMLKWLNASYNREHWKDVLEHPELYDKMVIDDAKNWNMTMLGYGGLRAKGRFPYAYRITFPGVSNWMLQAEFPDIFAPEFEQQCASAVERDTAGFTEDSYLIGYFFNDCPEWPILDRVSKRRPLNWINAIKSMGPQSAGKQKYVELMRERHGSIESFNAVYGTAFPSFDDVLASQDFIFEVANDDSIRRADDEAFLSLMAERYYSITVDAVRRADSHHLILGEIFDGNRGIPPQVLDAAAKRIDVISTQYYGFFNEQAPNLARWHEASGGKPILLADSCFNCLDQPLPEVVSPRMRNQEERAVAFERYARQALAVPYIVGWIWCGYIDGSNEVEARRQHQGIKDAWGRPHEPLSSTMTRTFERTYELAMQASSPHHN